MDTLIQHWPIAAGAVGAMTTFAAFLWRLASNQKVLTAEFAQHKNNDAGMHTDLRETANNTHSLIETMSARLATVGDQVHEMHVSVLKNISEQDGKLIHLTGKVEGLEQRVTTLEERRVRVGGRPVI